MINFQGNITTKLPGVTDSIFAVMSKLAVKEKAINLSQGFPDFPVDDQLISLVHKYMKEGKNQYNPMPGHLPLKQKISDKIRTLYGTDYNPDSEITITAGATQAIYTAITSIIKEKDEVMIFEPAYDSYLPSILLNKGVPKYIRLDPPDFRIDWEIVKRSISFNTRMIILNSPHNPTGSILTAEDMFELERIISDREIIVLSDEVYEHIIFDGQEHQSICKFPNLAEKAFAIFSFGKTYHTTGWKMGYVLAPERLMREFRKVFQFLMFTAPTPHQYAYTEYMSDPSLYHNLGGFYQKKRDLFLNGIKDSRWQIIPCNGTYFQCLGYDGISDEKDTDFAVRLTKENKIASIPLSVFHHDKSDSKILRFCFAKEEDTLLKATEILRKI